MTLRKIALSTLSLVVVAAMSACSNSTMAPSVASINATSDLSFASNVKPGTFDPITNSTFVADVGNGNKGATITVRMTDASAFKTKASTSGKVAGTFAAINDITFQLSDGVSTINVGPIAVAGTPFTGTAPTATRLFTFSNVPPHATTPGTGWGVTATSIKNAGAQEMLKSANPSTSKALVSSTYVLTFSPATPTSLDFGVALTDAVGASIDSTVTSTDGSAILPGVTAL